MMTLSDNEKMPISVAVNRATRFFRQTFTITEFDARKLYHEPSELILRSLQPLIWLLLFGQVLAQAHVIPVAKMTYLDFLTPGILAQSILFVAIFHGISVIWEKDLGIIQKFLVAPVSRIAIVFGKSLAAGIRSLPQVFIIYVLALLLSVNINYSALGFLGVILFTVIGAAIFSTFSLIIACIVKTRERFMGIGQVLTMPLFFASNAIYPVAMMPSWMRVLAHGNPLTYEVDALRTLMLQTGQSAYGLWFDFGILLAFLVVMLVIGARLYPKLAH